MCQRELEVEKYFPMGCRGEVGQGPLLPPQTP